MYFKFISPIGMGFQMFCGDTILIHFILSFVDGLVALGLLLVIPSKLLLSVTYAAFLMSIFFWISLSVIAVQIKTLLIVSSS